MRYGIYDRQGHWLCHTLDEAIHMRSHRLAEDGRLGVLMLFEKEELLHEAASKAWIQTDTETESGETSDSATHNYKEVAEEENWPMVSRWLTLATTEVEQMLYNLTRRYTHSHKSMDNRVKERQEWAIEMRVPEDASDTTLTLIMNLTNEYLVTRLLKEWSGLSYKPALPYWTEKQEELAEKIREAGRSCESMHRVKRPMWPAW